MPCGQLECPRSSGGSSPSRYHQAEPPPPPTTKRQASDVDSSSGRSPSTQNRGARALGTEARLRWRGRDRKSTRLNSSHGYISYAVFCLKKKNRDQDEDVTTQPSHPTLR